MIKLKKNGRIIFFEGIQSAAPKGDRTRLEMCDGSIVNLPFSLEEFLKRREEYFQELKVTGQITEEFGLQTVEKLRGELAGLISTLQAATTAYNTSAELANSASRYLKNTSDEVDTKAKETFGNAARIATSAARDFKSSTEYQVNEVLKPAVDKVKEQSEKLENELEYIQE